MKKLILLLALSASLSCEKDDLVCICERGEFTTPLLYDDGTTFTADNIETDCNGNYIGNNANDGLPENIIFLGCIE